jgi:hypothetical protein
MKRAVYRVQCLDGKWHLGGPRVPSALRWLRTRDQAVAAGVLACRLDQAHGIAAQLVLHGQDGRIRWERTYGQDPRRSPG